MPRKTKKPTKTEEKRQAATVDAMTRAMGRRLDEEIRIKGASARQAILEAGDDLLGALLDLARGFKMENAEGTVYSLPPLWSALKYLLDWHRQIINEGQKTEHEHKWSINPETEEFLKRFVNDRSAAPLPPPKEGAYILDGEFSVKEEVDGPG